MFNLLLPETLTDTPYHWGIVSPFIHNDIANSLMETFPDNGFIVAEKIAGEPNDKKMYSLETLQLEKDTPLSPIWHEFIQYLRSDQYRDRMGALIGKDLGSTMLNLTLWRYRSSQWLGPHTDKPEKIVTQIFNFNRNWSSDWGGCLRILRSDDSQDVDREIPPELNTSAILHRSDHSWHMVTPVSDTAPVGTYRRVLTAVFISN
ncbi:MULTISPECIES: 2OG-Fe(II) oxygenase family protein [Xenorhabdus]|uniref:2OG-Fe(II) oxygenase family protein n=2 Tax=Xenorhabdus TaxID=626 RepID=A0ABT5M5W6_9GAMM|nr:MULTISPECIES: 2OG-Fe(II) oxygenase family protein [Xenorhabdus]MDC9621671.1 2OG-Fe(II) oxygenase family protein [Xenorhabdus aichiensis]CDM90653.1 putative hydroxylase [Xenorhabdus bovienii]